MAHVLEELQDVLGREGLLHHRDCKPAKIDAPEFERAGRLLGSFAEVLDHAGPGFAVLVSIRYHELVVGMLAPGEIADEYHVLETFYYARKCVAVVGFD